MCTINWCCQKERVGRFGGDASQMWVADGAGHEKGWRLRRLERHRYLR